MFHNITEEQYYFPYFFSIEAFNKELSTFELSSQTIVNPKTELPEFLDILNGENILVSIPFGATIMIQRENLLFWTTNYDHINITQVKLNNTTYPVTVNQQIHLTEFCLGNNVFQSLVDVKNLVTYVRMKNLEYALAYFEKFVIVCINKDKIALIPFDSFNKTGGDYGYVWPALARLDLKENKLFGRGMRMSDFSLSLSDTNITPSIHPQNPG